MIQAVGDGVAVINMNSRDGNILASRLIEVNSDTVQLYRFDTIVSFLQVLVEQPSSMRLEPSVMRLQVTPGLFFAGARVNITVSAVLDDGSRLLLSDPSELNITSLDEDIVTVENLTLIAVSPGSGELITVEWIVCDQVLANSTAFIVVTFDSGRPIFTPSSDEISVPEDRPVGQLLYTVTAVDSDAAASNQTVHADVEYALQTGSDHDGLFTINKDTGDIILSRSLDRETEDNYVVVVLATDARQRMIMATMMEGSGSGEIKPPEKFEVSEQNRFRRSVLQCVHINTIVFLFSLLFLSLQSMYWISMIIDQYVHQVKIVNFNCDWTHPSTPPSYISLLQIETLETIHC